MIRRLSRGLGIPAAILIREPREEAHMKQESGRDTHPSGQSAA
jgi:hypothetical protein